MLDTNLSLQS